MIDAENLGQFKAVSLPQGTLRFREQGTGAPLVFIHGLLVNGNLWRKVVPPLALQYRCLVPDLPLGSHEQALEEHADLSPTGLARLIANFLAALDLEGATLIANDTGGALCQIVMTEYPERIGRVVLTNCDSYKGFLPLMFRPLQWGAHLPGFLWLIAQLLRMRWFQRMPMTYGWLAKYPLAPEVVDGYVGPLATNRGVRRDVRKVLRGISARYTLRAARKFPRFEKPVLLAWASEDHFFHLRYAQAHQQSLPNARLERIEDSYAFVPEDQPERLVGLIKVFLLQTEQAILS